MTLTNQKILPWPSFLFGEPLFKQSEIITQPPLPVLFFTLNPQSMPGRRRSKVFSIKEALKIRVLAAKRKKLAAQLIKETTLYHTGKHWTLTIFNSTYVSFGSIKLPTTNKSTKHVYIRSPSPTRNENLPFIHSKSYFYTCFLYIPSATPGRPSRPIDVANSTGPRDLLREGFQETFFGRMTQTSFLGWRTPGFFCCCFSPGKRQEMSVKS